MANDKTTSDNDLKLKDGILAAKYSAYQEFDKLYSKLIFMICLYSCKNHSDASELLNDILLKIFKKIDQYDSKKGSLKSWVIQVTKNYLRDVYRLSKNSVTEISLDDNYSDKTPEINNLDDEVMDEQELLDEKDLMCECLQIALESVSERDQQILKLRADGHENKEIAEFLNMKENAVKTAYSRGLKKIKELYSREKAKVSELKN